MTHTQASQGAELHDPDFLDRLCSPTARAPRFCLPFRVFLECAGRLLPCARIMGPSTQPVRPSPPKVEGPISCPSGFTLADAATFGTLQGMSESKRIRWEPRDTREWTVLSAEDDQLTARLVCTFLEANEIDARVGSRQGRFTVEVPQEQLEQARQIHGENPTDTNVVNLPPLQEVATVRTSQTTVRRIRAELVTRGLSAPAPAANHRGAARALLLLAALIAILGAVAWLVLWPRT